MFEMCGIKLEKTCQNEEKHDSNNSNVSRTLMSFGIQIQHFDGVDNFFNFHSQLTQPMYRDAIHIIPNIWAYNFWFNNIHSSHSNRNIY